MRKRPTVALIYDFDGTLSPGNMQEFGFIQAIGQTPDEFWSKSNAAPDGQEVSSRREPFMLVTSFLPEQAQVR